MPDDQFNVVPAPSAQAWQGPQVDLAGKLLKSQQPATKQPASTGTQATQQPGQLNAQAARNLGLNLGEALLRLSRPPQLGQPAQPQQQVGPPMNIVPQGYGYR